MAQSPNSPTKAPTLSRDLGRQPRDCLVVGTLIGSGIFLVPAEMMQAVGSAGLVYLAWIVGGVLSFAGALTYAELGAMKPQAGGEYIYIRDAYGPLPGFLYAWTTFAISKPASVATITTGFVRILGTFPALAFLNHAAIRSPLAHHLWTIRCNRCRSRHHLAELHRRQARRRVSTAVHDAKSRHDHRRGCAWHSAPPAARGGTSAPISRARPAVSPASWPRWSRRCGPTMAGTT